MDVGDAVEVHSTYLGTWATGFEVAAVEESGYRLRRVSDGKILPDPTGPEDVRPVRPS